MTMPRMPVTLPESVLHFLVLANSVGLLGVAGFVGGVVYTAGQRASQMDVNTSTIAKHSGQIENMEHQGTDYTRGVMEEIRQHLDRIDREIDNLSIKIQH